MGVAVNFCAALQQIPFQITLHAAHSKDFATFEEFISFLTKNQSSNSFGVIQNHWSTYNRICQPCSNKYDAIAYLETIEEDSRLNIFIIVTLSSLCCEWLRKKTFLFLETCVLKEIILLFLFPKI